MSEEFNIEKVLPFLFCAQCGCNFDIEYAKVLETGNDTVIVKVVCKCCGKKYALAFMDLTFPMFAQSYDDKTAASTSPECSLGGFSDVSSSNKADFEDEYYFEEKYSTGNMAGHIQAKNLEKITYDDVLEAHDFIQNFEENWRRYLDKRKFNTI